MTNFFVLLGFLASFEGGTGHFSAKLPQRPCRCAAHERFLILQCLDQCRDSPQIAAVAERDRGIA